MQDIASNYKAIIRTKAREIENQASAEMDNFLVSLRGELEAIAVDITVTQSLISKQADHKDTEYVFKDGSFLQIRPSLVEIY